MQTANCNKCSWPNKADPYKSKSARWIKCRRCKEPFDTLEKSVN